MIIRVDIAEGRQALAGLFERLLGKVRSRGTAFYLVVAALMLLPHLFSTPWAPGFGLPRVYSGDEPHYLVQIKSLVRDHDLDVSNNYEWAGAGDDDAGKYFRGQQLERHTAAQVDGRTVTWADFYDHDRWQRRADSSWPPAPLRDESRTAPTFRYSIHPEGIAVLFSPIWLAVGDSSLLEPAVVLLSAIVTLVALVFFRALLLRFTTDVPSVHLTLVATFFGTPLWHYGRTVFTEPYMMCFVVAAYALAYRSRRSWLAGFPIAAGLLMKPVFLLIPLPLLVLFLARRRFKDVALAACPVLAAFAYMLGMNTARFGGPFALSLPNLFEWNFAHMGDLVFDASHGLVPFAPVLLVAAVGWIRLLREATGEAWAMMVGAALYFLLFSCWTTWHGGFCYGPRYLLPIIPIIMVGCVKIPEMIRGSSLWLRVATTAIGALSIEINALGALPYWRFWTQHPLASLF